jgi:hypothetical protein
MAAQETAWRRERVRDEAKSSNRFLCVAAQSAILINGAAATAMLTFVSSAIRNKLPNLNLFFSRISYSIAGYSVGVLLAAASLITGSLAIDKFLTGHEGYSNQSYKEGDKYFKRGHKFLRASFLLVAISLTIFGCASLYLALGLSFEIKGNG